MPLRLPNQFQDNTDDNKVEETYPKQGKQPQTIHWEPTTPRYTLGDLIVDDATLSQILDAISYFQNRELLFLKWGLSERFSQQDGLAINLYGPPGTGKTMAAHAIVDALHVKGICVDYCGRCISYTPRL